MNSETGFTKITLPPTLICTSNESSIQRRQWIEILLN